jgi:hypothetical protein
MMKTFMKLGMISACSTAALCLAQQAAWAVPTASASPNPYNGFCPTTITFTGTLNAAAAGNMTYYFSYTDPAAPTKVINRPPKTVKAIAAGPVSVSDTGTMTLSGTGTMTLYETVPNVTHSTTVNIPLICSSAAHPAYPRASTGPNFRLAPLPNQQSVAVRLIASDMRSKFYNYATGEHPDIFENCDPKPSLCVGFYHNESDAGPVVMWHQIWTERAYLMYAKFPIGAQINKATITLNVTNPESANCFGGIGMATAPWIGNTTSVDGNFSFATPITKTNGGQTWTIDVTQIVKAWMSNKAANNGFVLRGSNENGSPPNNITCFMNFHATGMTLVEPVLIMTH